MQLVTKVTSSMELRLSEFGIVKEWPQILILRPEIS